jgi:hypothetical protein
MLINIGGGVTAGAGVIGSKMSQNVKPSAGAKQSVARPRSPESARWTAGIKAYNRVHEAIEAGDQFNQHIDAQDRSSRHDATGQS